MIADTIGSALLFLVLSTGMGWPLAARLRCSVPERLIASTAFSLLFIFLFAWSVYVFDLPVGVLRALPAIAAAALAFSLRSLRHAWADPEFRDLVITQGLVTSWCIGWLALVLSYSGGNWVGDWFGHWQRAVFFLERLSPHLLFNGFDPVTSRPPLANIVVGAFMFITRNDFAHYQLGMTVVGSLTFLPAALLARRFGSAHSIRVLALFLMVSPLFVQNATFAWTKLPATLFTLAALYWFLRAHDADEPAPARPMVAANLGAAILTHYSAAPYALVLAVAWLAFGWARRSERQWWQTTATSAGIGTLILAPWFAWALTTYGGRGTFLNNPSITDQAPTAAAQLWTMVLNIRDTIVPHFFRWMEPGWIAQASPWGWWRDWFFNLYQTNLIFAFGSVAWLVILIKLVHDRHTVSSTQRHFWSAFIISISILGVAVHGGRGEWGLAHICLQPLVLLGLAFLAAAWESLRRPWRWLLIGGAVVDFTLGIALQFSIQGFLLEYWLSPTTALVDASTRYSPATMVNMNGKRVFHFTFLGDHFGGRPMMILLLLGALAALALSRTGRRQKALPL